MNLPEEAIPKHLFYVSSSSCAEGHALLDQDLPAPLFSTRWKAAEPRLFSPLTEKELQEIRILNELKQLRDKIDSLSSCIRNKPIIKTVVFRDLNSEKYILKENIEIIIEEYSEEAIASWQEIEAFGHGVSIQEAIMNLKNEIIDLYEDLLQSKPEELGNGPKAYLKILNKTIEANR